MSDGRRPSRRVVRQRRFAAAAVAVLVLVALVLVVRAVAFRPDVADFAGTWEGSDASLGSTTLKIGHGAGSGDYVITGLKPAGTVITSLHVSDDGRLTATGRTANGAWHVSLDLTADNRQMLAEYAPPGGAPTILRFTRAPAP